MGSLQTLGSLPGGHLIFEAVTGSVSPYRLEQVKKETGQGVMRAKGPNASRAEKQAAADAAKQEVDSFLKSTGRHPDDASLLSPGLEELGKNITKGFKWFVFLGATALTVYFGVQLISLTRRTRG